MPITQANRDLAITTPLGEDKLLIVSASVSEQVGRLFQMDVDLTSEDGNVSFDKIVGGNATIRLTLPNRKTPRYFNGFVSRFVQTSADGDGGRYRASLVPWLWFLTRTADCRIFQNKTVPDIIKQVFRDHGFTDFTDSLAGTYTPWENCVQYRETDFNFVSRLMEHEGIYYFFEHDNGKHTLVLADGSSAHKPYEGYETIKYNAQRSQNNAQEIVYGWTLEQEVQPGTYALNDFNFEKPKTSLVAQSDVATQNAQSTFAIYDYPGEYGEQSEGSDYAKVRVEEMHSQHEVVQGNANVFGLTNGYTFTLTNAARRDQNRKYLITSTSCHLEADSYLNSSKTANSSELFDCTFTAIDATKPFRAARVTPKPLIQGPQTAIVVGPKGEEIHTDKYGRIKVQFHWDRYGKADENSSCWVRVSQSAWAGKKWGAFSLPRVGQEVIVEFLEGDPDLPIVTGQVYNADTMPPYDLPANKTMSTLKTNSTKGGGGFNEFRFEDKKGSEQIFIHGEKDLDVRVKHDRMEYIGNDRHLHVVNNKYENVDKDRHEEVGTSHFEKIGTDRNLTVGGKDVVDVSANQSVKVGGNMNCEVTGDATQKVGGGIIITATGDIILKSSSSISLNVGGKGILIDMTGVHLTGTTIDAQADATLQLTGGATTTIKGGVVMIN